MYSKRIVLLADILGFKEIVKNKEFDKVNYIYARFSQLTKHFAVKFNQLLKTYQSALEFPRAIDRDDTHSDFIAFSDSVVWTYPIEEIKHFPKEILLECLTFALNEMLGALIIEGIVIRGGLTIGDIYVKDNRIFGEALIRAYALEQVANFPRIAFDSSVVEEYSINNLPLFKYYFEKEEISKGESCRFYPLSYLVYYTTAQEQFGKKKKDNTQSIHSPCFESC